MQGGIHIRNTCSVTVKTFRWIVCKMLYLVRIHVLALVRMDWLGWALPGAPGGVGRLEGARLHGAGPTTTHTTRLGQGRLIGCHHGVLQQLSRRILNNHNN